MTNPKESPSTTTGVSYRQLCELAILARRNGTQDAFVDVAVQWAGEVTKALAATSPVGAPEGWKIERRDCTPFKRIHIVAPNGYAAVVDSLACSLARNPENILYMLAEALLAAAPTAQPVRLTDERIDAIAHAQDDPGDEPWFTRQITKLEWRYFARAIEAEVLGYTPSEGMCTVLAVHEKLAAGVPPSNEQTGESKNGN